MAGSKMLQARDGVSLVEAIVAILLLTVIVTALAAHLFQVSRRTLAVANDGHRQAVITREFDRLTALPFDQLENNGWQQANAAWHEFPDPPYPHRRKILVAQAQDGKALELRLVIDQELPIQRVDTILLVRPRPVGGNPFNVK